MSTSIDYQKLYELSDPLGNQALRLQDDADWLDKKLAQRLYSGQLQQTEHPLKLYAYQGGQAMDFLWSGFTPIRCISRRVVDLLQTHQLTGWSTYPVEVYDRKGEPLLDYYGFAVTGQAGERDRSRSEIITKPPRVPSAKPYQEYKGLFFEESSWDGSDFFVLANSYWTIVTHAVWAVFRKHKVNNVRLIRLTEVEIPVSLDRV